MRSSSRIRRSVILPTQESLLRWISNFGGSNTFADFDPVLARKSAKGVAGRQPGTSGWSVGRSVEKVTKNNFAGPSK